MLWHAAQAGIEIPLPENSMDVDPVTDSDEVAFLGYDAMVGSEFEKEHGWHVNLMPAQVLNGMPPSWRDRASLKNCGHLLAVVPSIQDLMYPS